MTTIESNDTARAVDAMSSAELLAGLEGLAPPEEQVGSDRPEVHEIHTTCGRVFKMTVAEMSDRQLESLIRQNQDSDALPEMEAELARRQKLNAEAA
jgi:hypothetical protein